MEDPIKNAKDGCLKFFEKAQPENLLKAEDTNGDTVLLIVVNLNHVDCCKKICEICPSLLYQKSRQGNTPLHIAVLKGYLDILEVLISTCDKADQEGVKTGEQKTLRLKNSNGYNVMHIAAFGSQLECIKLLIEEDPYKDLLKAGDNNNNTPLHLAVKRNKAPEIARLLFLADPSFEYGVNSLGMNPLHLAIENTDLRNRGMLNLIMKLQPTQSKMSMESNNEKGWKALHYSVYKRKFSITKLIIQSFPESSEATDNEGQNFVHHAVKLVGCVENVKPILGMKDITETILNSPDKKRRTPLDIAVENKNERMILYLLENSLVKQKLTVPKNLQWVVDKHNFKIMNKFLKTNAELLKDIEVKEGDSILFKAAQENDLFLCKHLYNKCSSLLYYQNKDKSTALHHAALRGESKTIKFLIDLGPSSSPSSSNPQKNLLTMVDEKGDTALHIAVLKHKLEAVQVLVEKDKAHEYVANASGDTPIMISVREARSNENKFYTEEIRRLLFRLQPSQTVKPIAENGRTLLHQATSEGDFNCIEDFIKFCPGFLIVKDNEGKNFLHIAAQLGNDEVVRKVLREKDIIPPEVLKGKDHEGKTFLHIATELKKFEVVKQVLRSNDIIKFCKSCLEQVDNKGQNFLHIAAELGNVEVVRLVLTAQAITMNVLNGKDKEGKNFLHIAAELEKVDVVKQVLIAKDIPSEVLNDKDNEGNTPFHFAAITGNESLTKCLLYDRRIDKEIENNNGENFLSSINFPYDKRKAGVFDIVDTVDQSDLREQREFDLIVVALIATVSFTAGITVPGGYISDGAQKKNQGTAVLSKKVSFAIFIISNTFALMCSLYAVIIHIYARRTSKNADIKLQVKVATFCTVAAIFFMMAAFVAGSFAVLANSIWIPIVVGIIVAFSAFGIIILSFCFKRAAPVSQHRRSNCKCFGFS